MCLPCLELTECMTCCCVYLSQMGHFGKVHLEHPPLSTVVKLLCLQQVTKINCEAIQGCEVSFSVRCNDNSYL